VKYIIGMTDKITKTTKTTTATKATKATKATNSRPSVDNSRPSVDNATKTKSNDIDKTITGTKGRKPIVKKNDSDNEDNINNVDNVDDKNNVRDWSVDMLEDTNTNTEQVASLSNNNDQYNTSLNLSQDQRHNQRSNLPSGNQNNGRTYRNDRSVVRDRPSHLVNTFDRDNTFQHSNLPSGNQNNGRIYRNDRPIHLVNTFDRDNTIQHSNLPNRSNRSNNQVNTFDRNNTFNRTRNNNSNISPSALDFDRELNRKFDSATVESLSTEDLLKVIIRRAEDEKNPVISGGCGRILKQINKERIGIYNNNRFTKYND
jgi:hypothetical protein